MFKRTRFAAIVAIVVAMVVANTADARPGGSFRGGFSSGKSTVSRSVAKPRQPAFGSFGKRQAQPPAAARTPQRDSAMSRDLERQAARDQAMRTYDARRAATTPPLPPLDPVLPGGRQGGGSGGYARSGVPGGGATSAPAPVIVRDSNNGWLWGIGGFMLGRATGSQAAPPPPSQPAQAPAALPETSANAGAMAEAAGASDIAGAGVAPVAAAPAQVAAKPAAREASTIVKLAVVLLACGLAWLAWKAFRLMAEAQNVKKHANYSFERN
jgi:hypothetical protein